MNISSEKLEIIQRIIDIQDNELLSLVKSIISAPGKSKTDWWDQISEEEIESINRGLEDHNQGRVQSHDQIRKKYEKWLKD